MDEPSINSLGRVMVVDDDIVDRFACARLLNRLGLAEELHSLPDAETAMRRIADDAGFEVDVIFLDVNMPRMNGLEFLEAIDQAETIRFRGAVVVLVSTDLPPAMHARFAEIPCVKGFIRKPMTAEGLAATAKLLSEAA